MVDGIKWKLIRNQRVSFWYLSHVRKVAHQTYMDIYQVGLDTLILAWTFIYTFQCVYGQWRLWQCCAKAQVRRLQTCMAS